MKTTNKVLIGASVLGVSFMAIRWYFKTHKFDVNQIDFVGKYVIVYYNGSTYKYVYGTAGAGYQIGAYNLEFDSGQNNIIISLSKNGNVIQTQTVSIVQ